MAPKKPPLTKPLTMSEPRPRKPWPSISGWPTRSPRKTVARHGDVEVEGEGAVAHRHAVRVDVEQHDLGRVVDVPVQVVRPVEGAADAPPDALRRADEQLPKFVTVSGEKPEASPGARAASHAIASSRMKSMRSVELLLAAHAEVEGELQVVARDARVEQRVEEVLEMLAARLERRDRRRPPVAQRAEGRPRAAPACRSRRACGGTPRCSGGRARGSAPAAGTGSGAPGCPRRWRRARASAARARRCRRRAAPWGCRASSERASCVRRSRYGVGWGTPGRRREAPDFTRSTPGRCTITCVVGAKPS